MITASDIYWVTRLDDFCGFFAFMGAVLIINVIIRGIILFNKNMDDDRELGIYRKKFSCSIILVLSVFFVLSFIPSTKVAAGMYIIPKLANNPDINNVPKELLNKLIGKDDK